MKRNYLYNLLTISILLISSTLKAQEVSIDEESRLNFQTYFFEALKQRAIKNYDKAIENLEKSYEIDSVNAAVAFEFSKNYAALNKYFEAQLFIDKALVKEPMNEYFLKKKVAILKVQNRYKDAIFIQKKLVNIHPKYYDDLVLLYIKSNNLKEAQKQVLEIEKKALVTTKTISYKNYIIERLVTLNSKKQPSKRENTIVFLKKKYKETTDYKVLKQLLTEEKEARLFKELLLDTKEALELFPYQPFLYKMGGIALNRLGKYKEAVNVLLNGIDFVFDDDTLKAIFYEELAISYKGLNKSDKALSYKQKALQLRKKI